MKNKIILPSIEISHSLHENLLKSPFYIKRMKNRNVAFFICTLLLLILNFTIFFTSQEKFAEELILETQYANFGSDLSI